MIDRPEDSETVLKELLQGSILKTPSRDFTSKLMIEVAQLNDFKVASNRRLFQKALILSVTALISVIACTFIGFTFFSYPLNLQLTYSISAVILTATQYFISNIIGVYYLVIPILLLWLIDKYYLNLKFANQK